MEDNRKIVITHLPLSKEREDVLTIVKRSKRLITTIVEYSKSLRKQGVKVYERMVNIIRTEHGYYCAFYQDDIEQLRNGKKDFPKPFKGIDGRMKIQLTDKNGQSVTEDLAEMIAKTFLPNPDNYQFVGFKDQNPENCKIENLFWSQIKQKI